MLQLKNRILQPELMDDPTLSDAEHHLALRGLARVHRLTRTAARLWKKISRLDPLPRPLRILDVGCGDALMLRELYRLARRSGLGAGDIELHGCDFSARALEMAQSAAAAEEVPLNVHLVDVLRDSLPIQADVVMNSLFLHHFSDDEVRQILEKFRAAAERLLLVEDLLRSQLGYALCFIGIHALSRSKVVHVDGLLSVRAAFRSDEIKHLAATAGLTDVRIERHWPERFLIAWEPPCHA